MDIIVTKPIKAKELIKEIQDEFLPNDIITTGLWIRKKK
jgi:hypothetical protein